MTCGNARLSLAANFPRIGASSFMLSPHTWLLVALCSLPLLIVAVLRVLDAGRPPSNEMTQEQGDDEEPGRGPDLLPVAA